MFTSVHMVLSGEADTNRQCSVLNKTGEMGETIPTPCTKKEVRLQQKKHFTPCFGQERNTTYANSK